MKHRKQIILTKLFEFGGSNSHLVTLIKYFGKDNIILAVEDTDQLKWLNNIEGAEGIQTSIVPNLHKFAHLVSSSRIANIKEAFLVVRSVIRMLLIAIRHGADITICAVEPEKYLYLLWVPFVGVKYILHTTPVTKFTKFTSYTCNTKLGKQKSVITVSKANRNAICSNWDVSTGQQQFVHVVYNCLLKPDGKPVHVFNADGTKNVITLGHVTDYKNPYLWLEVARRITKSNPGVQFTWLGNGPLYDHFCSETVDDSRISFAGFKADTDHYLQQATLYYQPSMHETHGIAVVEAMYHGLPCVVSDVGGLPESVLAGYNGLLAAPDNVEANVTAIDTLLSDPDQLENFGANAYKRYLDLFTFEKFKLKMDAIYN